MVTVRDLNQIDRQSVQDHAPATSYGYDYSWWGIPTGTSAPAWGLHARDRWLRNLYRNPYNWIGQAAVAALTRKVKQVPWVIEGGKNNVAYYQKLLQDAHFGAGWGEFISRTLLDYLTCDYGAYVEVIARGNPTSQINSRVTGIASLDSLRCVPTGNLIYPVIYWNRGLDPAKPTMHRMQKSRVYRWVDMPDNDETFHLAGLCSMSRAIAIIEQQIPLSKYLAATFSDLPPVGVFYNNSGMGDGQWKEAKTAFDLKRQNGQGGILTVNNGNLTNEVKGSFLPFAVAPENFNYTEYTEIAVNAFAACFGIDRQDLWPLTGRLAGTAMQSDVMQEKAYGMAFGDILSSIERMLNNAILPENVEFRFEYKDAEKDKQTGEADAIVLANASALSALGIPSENVLKYLAANSEQFRDVLSDENGEMISLPDTDRVPATEVQNENDIEVQALEAQADDNTAKQPNDSQLADDNAAKRRAKKSLSRESFAYIPLANDSNILAIQRELKTLFPDERIEWQAAPTFHVTLCFAGIASDEAISKMVNLINLEALELQFTQGQGLNYFNTPDGKALYIEIAKNSVLDAIQANVYSAFETEAYDLSEFSKPASWNPHVTLAYIPNDIEINTASLNSRFEWLDSVVIPSDKVIIGRDSYDPVVIITAPEYKASKEIQATRLDFENRFDSIMASMREGELNRRRAGSLLRSLIATTGARAYRDTLEANGVDSAEMDSDDKSTIQMLTAQQSAYVSAFTQNLITGDGISDAQAGNKAAQWWGRSIMPFANAALLSAQANKMYRWDVSVKVKKHSPDCLKLNGQVHRLKAYFGRQIYPNSSKLDCGDGGLCRCTFTVTTERAVGNFL